MCVFEFMECMYVFRVCVCVCAYMCVYVYVRVWETE